MRWSDVKQYGIGPAQVNMVANDVCNCAAVEELVGLHTNRFSRPETGSIIFLEQFVPNRIEILFESIFITEIDPIPNEIESVELGIRPKNAIFLLH